jgi:hypothetical protein
VPKHSLPPQEQISSYTGRFINCPYGTPEKGTVDFFEDEAKTKWYKLDKDILISDERTGYVKELSRISPIVRHMVNAPRMKRLYVEKQ